MNEPQRGYLAVGIDQLRRRLRKQHMTRKSIDPVIDRVRPQNDR
jgi:SOS response regulatory protein OraA/RecX